MPNRTRRVVQRTLRARLARWTGAVFLGATLLPTVLVTKVSAQVADSLGISTDSVVVVLPGLDSLAVSRATVPSFADSAAVRLPTIIRQESKTRAARLPYLDIPALLADTRGAWVYDFGTPGWPDGWSPYGADPGSVSLTLDDIPLDDPVTGRPDFSVLPFDKLRRHATGGLINGRTDGVTASVSLFASSRPLTEIVYRSTNTGLQQVSVAHSQTRRGLGQAPIQYLFAYAGAGARGEYDGSRLQRKRQLLLRLRRETEGMRLELGEMFNRHRVGAHGGVQPFSGFEYESIYQRLGATVENEGAVRQTSRNDIWLRAELPDRQTWAKVWWTVGTLTHRVGIDTTVARVSRIGIKLGQPLMEAGKVIATVSAFRDTYPDRNAWTRSPEARFESTARLSGRFRMSFADISWASGITTLENGLDGTTLAPGYSVDVTMESRFGRPFIRSRRGVRSHSAADLFGFGGTVNSSEAARNGRQSLDEVGASLGSRGLHFEASAFMRRTLDDVVRILDVGADTLTVTPYLGSRARLGVTARIGFRDTSSRGFFGSLQGMYSSLSGDDSVLDLRLAASVPEFFGTGVAGIRGLLFQDDLDGELSIRVRGWSSHRGLRLHAPTGLLALPDPDARPIAESFVVDLVGIAHIRTATLTVSLENMLSGTNLTPGNQLVPDYPYPSRRLRFSVFWPIKD